VLSYRHVARTREALECVGKFVASDFAPDLAEVRGHAGAVLVVAQGKLCP